MNLFCWEAHANKSSEDNIAERYSQEEEYKDTCDAY